jgi:hypothetical protein
VARERMTWPNWYDGAQGTGPIANLYHIRGYPSIFVIDAKGIIRSRAPGGLDEIVDKLLAEMKQPDSDQGTPRPGPPRVEASAP